VGAREDLTKVKFAPKHRATPIGGFIIKPHTSTHQLKAWKIVTMLHIALLSKHYHDKPDAPHRTVRPTSDSLPFNQFGRDEKKTNGKK